MTTRSGGLLHHPAALNQIVFTDGNPLALNYAQWAAFLHSFYKWAQLQRITPSSIVDRQVRANAMAIANGWEGLDFSDPNFPLPE
jgi:hypothetical protein